MPNFLRPRAWPMGDVYPRQAGQLIEELRRFIGHDRLLEATALYQSKVQVAGGVRIARFREQQPLIEAFESYERATRHRRRALRSVDSELAGLANVAAHYSVIAPTLSGSLERHHRSKLLDLNGQLHPLLLEWKTASHFARANEAELAWLPVDQPGPEFIARAGDREWEVECKRQSHMVIELLGLTEADELADRIFRRTSALGLQGKLSLSVPADFDATLLADVEMSLDALEPPIGIGRLHLALPGGMVLEGELRTNDGCSVEAGEWQATMRSRQLPGARLYAYATAKAGFATDPLELQMTGPRRGGVELVEYLWDRKFSRAAAQCSGQRAAVLSFEWEGMDDPSLFAESPGIQDLLARTFDQYRHVAAISMRCDASPSRMSGVIDYAVGAYLARSKVTTFPEVASMVRLDSSPAL